MRNNLILLAASTAIISPPRHVKFLMAGATATMLQTLFPVPAVASTSNVRCQNPVRNNPAVAAMEKRDQKEYGTKLANRMRLATVRLNEIYEKSDTRIRNTEITAKPAKALWKSVCGISYKEKPLTLTNLRGCLVAGVYEDGKSHQTVSLINQVLEDLTRKNGADITDNMRSQLLEMNIDHMLYDLRVRDSEVHCTAQAYISPNRNPEKSKDSYLKLIGEWKNFKKVLDNRQNTTRVDVHFAGQLYPCAKNNDCSDGFNCDPQTTSCVDPKCTATNPRHIPLCVSNKALKCSRDETCKKYNPEAGCIDDVCTVKTERGFEEEVKHQLRQNAEAKKKISELEEKIAELRNRKQDEDSSQEIKKLREKIAELEATQPQEAAKTIDNLNDEIERLKNNGKGSIGGECDMNENDDNHNNPECDTTEHRRKRETMCVLKITKENTPRYECGGCMTDSDCSKRQSLRYAGAIKDKNEKIQHPYAFTSLPRCLDNQCVECVTNADCAKLDYKPLLVFHQNGKSSSFAQTSAQCYLDSCLTCQNKKGGFGALEYGAFTVATHNPLRGHFLEEVFNTKGDTVYQSNKAESKIVEFVDGEKFHLASNKIHEKVLSHCVQHKKGTEEVFYSQQPIWDSIMDGYRSDIVTKFGVPEHVIEMGVSAACNPEDSKNCDTDFAQIVDFRPKEEFIINPECVKNPDEHRLEKYFDIGKYIHDPETGSYILHPGHDSESLDRCADCADVAQQTHRKLTKPTPCEEFGLYLMIQQNEYEEGKDGSSHSIESWYKNLEHVIDQIKIDSRGFMSVLQNHEHALRCYKHESHSKETHICGSCDPEDEKCKVHTIVTPLSGGDKAMFHVFFNPEQKNHDEKAL